MEAFPGSAKLVLVPGVAHLNEPVAVFEAMVSGWSRQQNSRQLGQATIRSREQLVRRFTEFAGTYPWEWTPGDVEDFTVSLTSGGDRLALSTIRGYHLTLRLFCDYLADQLYEWAKQRRDRFDTVPSQVRNEWNTVAHLNDYEGKPQRRPLTYRELELLFDYLDDRVEVILRAGRKGSLVALRDSLMIKTVYAFGLRRNEVCRLDVADLRPNPHMRKWGTYGSVHVRFGKATKGSLPRRRTVLAVPELDWVVDGLRQWVEQARPLFDGHCCIEGSGGAVTGRLVVGAADRGPDRLEWTVVRHHRGHQPGCAALSTGSLAADPRPDGLMRQCPLPSGDPVDAARGQATALPYAGATS